MYLALTGGRAQFAAMGGGMVMEIGTSNLHGFWRLSPAELIEWCEIKAGREEIDMDDLEVGEEVEE